jgi:hypothetical protein
MRRIDFLLFLLLTFSISTSLFAQFSIKNQMGDELPNPWAGGLDACQFGRMDLDGDGMQDLLVFDRRGNRLLTYLNKGIEGEIDFVAAPEYTDFFPEFNEWVIFTDYNGDGFEDIFTYSQGWAGIKVYRHLGTYPPQFELVVSPYLTSLQGEGYVNILATNADYPALYDVDKDGDLDLLSFWSLGTFIELHTNRSIEFYGHADSLIYERTDFCWGRVAENEENNEMYLDTCLFKQSSLAQGRTNRHRGATFGVKDLNNDGLPELMLADVDYPGISMFTNGGTVDQAFMIHQDTAFPAYSTPVRLFSMPLPYFTDINNDGLSDMLVSPFDPNYEVTENVNSIWLYLNEGTENEPDFSLLQKDFLQEEMLDFGSGAYPLLADLDGDSLNDLLVGNWGSYQFSWYVDGTLFSRQQSQIQYFRQVGSAENTVYELAGPDLGGLFSHNLKGLVPAAADLNDDGLTDLLIGNELGTLIYMQQQANGVFAEAAESFLQIDVGSYSAPQLFDLDRDGVLDLIVGKKNGTISFFRGSETTIGLIFNLVTDFLGEVNVTDFNLSYDGYSTPKFFRTAEDETMLLVGSEQGKLYLFEDIDGNLEGIFQASGRFEELFGFPASKSDRGMRTSVEVLPPNEAGKHGLIVGNYSGGLYFFNGMAEVLPGFPSLDFFQKLKISPNPANNVVFIEIPSQMGKSVNLNVFTLSGIKIKQQQVLPATNVFRLNIADFQRGVYILRLSNSDGVAFGKLIKN